MRLRPNLVRFLASSACALAAVAWLAPAPVAAQTCDASRLLIILDQSSSMTRNQIGGETLWEIAVDALDQVTTDYQDKLKMGLMKYPGDSGGEQNMCTTGELYVSPALGSKADIMLETADAPPFSGNYTPMLTTIQAAKAVPALSLNDVPNYAVLVTDGYQWCDYDDEQQDAINAADALLAIDEVKALSDMGVKTYVVGFGASVDTYTLNQMAVKGETAVAGCDPTNTDPMAPDNCYYQANTASEFIDAMADIADNSTDEVCDGIDNDCDGFIDEDVPPKACGTNCGSGVEECIVGGNGDWTECNAPPEEEEVCDGIDNDCDGTTDPDCECVNGIDNPRECGQQLEVGICQPGIQTCLADNTWSDCEGEVGPENEACNGLDDDCDGFVDESKVEEEVAPDLCGPGYVCEAGECEPLDPVIPPENEGEIPAIEEEGTASGCGCRANSNGSGGGLATGFLGLLGMFLVLRRRRVRS